MGETSDGSPNAARGARAAADAEKPAGETSSLLARLFGWADADLSDKKATETEASAEATLRAASGAAGERAREMLLNLRRLQNLRVEDVAVPRADIMALALETPLDEVVQVFRETALTRLPVFGDTLDEPLGFLNLKDLALRHGFGGAAEVDMRAMLRPMLYVPPSMPIGTLLQRMQTSRTHIALVIDEYGGVDGLVTIEDLLEQIVGEIEDEHDEIEVRPWREEAPNCFIAQARTELDDFSAATGVDLRLEEQDEEIDTLGGLVFRLSGRIPERGEIIPHPHGHEFEVIEADPRRIKRLRLRLNQGTAVLDKAAE
ncbi:MAG: transporter associated domain-containing protein [Pseudomonadota bacterium]